MKPPSRKLQHDDDDRWATPSLSVNYSPDPDPLLQPIDGSPSTLNSTKHFKPNSPFDSSVAVTSLVLLAALFFIGIASLYIRRCAEDAAEAFDSRRRRPRPSNSSSSVPPSRSTSTRGLDPSTVQSMPWVPYGGEVKHPTDCAICLSEFEVGETVRLIPYCHHVFHLHCIDTWLSSHVSCPLCRCTQILSVEEVRFGAVHAGDDQGVNDNQRRSTTESGATRVEEEVEPVGMRRVCSCSSLGDPVSQQTSRGT